MQFNCVYILTWIGFLGSSPVWFRYICSTFKRGQKTFSLRCIYLTAIIMGCLSDFTQEQMRGILEHKRIIGADSFQPAWSPVHTAPSTFDFSRQWERVQSAFIPRWTDSAVVTDVYRLQHESALMETWHRGGHAHFCAPFPAWCSDACRRFGRQRINSFQSCTQQSGRRQWLRKRDWSKRYITK